MPIKQDQRVAKLETALGTDVLGLTRFAITEGLSELFEWQLEAVSEKDEKVNFDQAIGRPCSITVKTYDTDRLFHGILAEAQWVGIKGRYKIFKLEVVPWPWLLTHTTNCRIFSDKSVPDIIKQVFNDKGFTDFKMNLSESHPEREYCVQYRETDFAFVSRLMEEEGIVYYFDHSSDKHTMMMVDSNSHYNAVPNRSTIPFIASVGSDWPGREHLHDWHKEQRFRSGKVALNDYHFKEPNSSLKAEKEAATPYKDARKAELYDHPGNYKKRGDGERFAQVRLDAQQALDHHRYGTGEAVTLYPGGLVTLEKHPENSENAQYLVVRATHRYMTEAYASEAQVTGASDAYDGDYEFLPKDRTYRCLAKTPRPLVYGMHTAKVVGPSGEEIHVDEFGRIRVEFFWDRDKKQSRWTRVAHLWAGKQWGTQFIPRVGMEVVLTYEEGDPDHPIVIGCVYNGDNKHPYTVPGNKTQSGLKSNSSKGGGGYNEFMFEDKKGSEKIRMHAQKDHEVVVLNNASRSIGNNLTTTVANSETREIGKNFKPPTGAASYKTTVKNGDVELKVESGTLKYEAKLKMEFIVGPSKITIDPTGITLDAPTITIKAATACVIQGLPVKIN